MIRSFLEFALTYWYVWVVIFLVTGLRVSLNFSAGMLRTLSRLPARPENKIKKFLSETIETLFLFGSLGMVVCAVLAAILPSLARFW